MTKQKHNTVDAHEEATEREAIRTLHQLRDSGEEPTIRDSAAEEEGDIKAGNSVKEEKLQEDEKAKDKRAAAEERKAKRKRIMATIESVFTGDILLAKEATRVYNFLILLGVIFLASIFTMFSAFQNERECSKLQEEVYRLREERTQVLSSRISSSTHSAIIKKLKERGIELEDPTTTPTILE
jgi:hypothetical protein